ncbi:hypothetical protein PtA15_8A511 [Puccinia triticina]|uniref:Uncharacterized protein n=1 Tax=Puccinia triticina TaxID=208348 RepID=A0ABY7CQQ7_9BASI|nr:uncharacterized protein PtA15_8A511 [Puccinia triticina]WAQ87606.1 hypothetical protein PtA15_8A511 [Puccinia triticina]WAR57457.1 hypothetical protein PtB15_8B506 [Puccinia triticina]
MPTFSKSAPTFSPALTPPTPMWGSYFKSATPKKKGRKPKRLNEEIELVNPSQSNNGHNLSKISKL